MWLKLNNFFVTLRQNNIDIERNDNDKKTSKCSLRQNTIDIDYFSYYRHYKMKVEVDNEA